jgi:starch phosphorylase
MQPLHIYKVVSRLPAKLAALRELAYNLWFAWNSDLVSLFASINHQVWLESRENPVAFLNMLPQEILEDLAKDEFFLTRLKEAKRSLEQYLSRTRSAFAFPENGADSPVVAYFSFEYGLALCLPIYSGGLGILAGDHLKSASDLNIPLVAVGLCYRQGFFRQYMTPDGWQQERYPDYEFDQLPLKLVKDKSGEPLRISVDLRGHPLRARVWVANVGKVRLFLLDTNLPENSPEFRQITARLYGGNLEMRLWQEILLGIGGVKALTAMGLAPKVIHMNEGHSAFAGLERIRVLMEEGLSFEAAMEVVASSSVFTTHTPVPAGNDRFPPELMKPYFEGYAKSLGLAYKVFMALGRENPRDDSEHFCMTVLALRLSRFNNGVSTLHGRVSRAMWKRVWPQYPVEDVPIGAITNGVHMPTWVAKDLALLFDRYLAANWREEPDCKRVWDQAEDIPDAEIWRTHERLRERLVDFVRKRLRKQIQDKGGRRRELQIADEVLDPQALTIGFARRFATYKRANLLFLDKERLLRLVSDKKHRVQFIFAGKAHPADNEGKKLIQELIQFCRREECRYSMVFIEDYDMKIASRMVQGCDIWLNNPRRPLEACGTSGMKAMANGVLQFSTLDGWWDEAYRPGNSLGWAIGRGEEYDDASYQDFVESQTLYTILENDIVPEFYDRGHGNLPRAWILKMKNALKALGPVFNAHRMVEDYVERAYLPAYKNYAALLRDKAKPAKSLAAWRMEIMTRWSSLEIRNVRSSAEEYVNVGEPIVVEAEIQLAGLSPDNVQAELYYGPVGLDENFTERRTAVLSPQREAGEGWHLYRGEITPTRAGRIGFTVRILPHHPLLLDPRSLGLIHWAEE